MKVLFFIESLRAGGKERRVIELVKALIEMQNKFQIFLVLTRNEIHYKEVHSLGIPIYFIERKYLKKDPLLFYKFFSLVRKIKPDLIHVWGHMVAVYAVPTKILLNIPLINNEIVGSIMDEKDIGKDIVFRFSDRIIANSLAGLKVFNAPMEKSRVIYNGFNFDRVLNLRDKNQVRSHFGIVTNYVVGMVASFNDFKDYKTFIESALILLNKRNDVTFLCIGDGDDSNFRNLVPESKKDKVLFLGRQTQVESIINLCEVGVLTTHGEGISNALMEFMALEKPVLTTNLGGCVELIDDNENGYLLDPLNPEQLAQKINYLLDHEEARIRMGKRAKQTIKNKFSQEAMLKSFIEEYENIIKR
jgi:glycosyltransferase involved in cell wall biosynthesis